MVKLKLISTNNDNVVFETEVPLTVFEKHHDHEHIHNDEYNCGCCGGDPYLAFAETIREKLVGNILEETKLVTTFKDEVIYTSEVLPYDYFNDEFSIVDAIPPALYTVAEVVRAKLKQ